MAPLALGYGAGILCGWQWSPPLGMLLLAAGILLPILFLSSRLRLRGLVLLLFLAGWVNLARHTAILSPLDLRLAFKGEPEIVTLRGRLVDTPSQRVYEQSGQETWRTLAVVEVEEACRGGDWQPVLGTVAVSTPDILPQAFFGGQAVEIQGVIQSPRGPMAEGLFDYRQYLYWQGIYFQVRCESTNDWQLSSAHPPRTTPPLSDRFLAWAQRTLALGMPGEDESLRLIWAMTLGWKTALTNEVSEPFMRTGTMHVFAISGLHIALISGMLIAVLRVLQAPRNACGWVVVPLIWFYTAATGWQSPAIRSTVMMTVIIVGWAVHRPGNLFNSLAGSALILLLWEPRQLFQASFQLSFFVVLSLALLEPALKSCRERLHRRDPLIPETEPRVWERWRGNAFQWLTASFATSLAAWLGSMPLIIYYFHLITPIGLVANLIVVPLSSLALMCNLGSLATSPWAPPVAVLFNHAGWFFMMAMDVASQWLARVPAGNFHFPDIGFIDFLWYYLGLCGLLWWMEKPSHRRMIPMAVAGLLVAGRLTAWALSTTTPSLTVLPVAGGDAVLYRASFASQNMLVDTGDENVARFLVKPFLQSQGINRLAHVVVTHGDVDHAGGYGTLAEFFNIHTLAASGQKFRSPVYRAQLEARRASCEPLRWVQAGDRIGAWTVLHPRADDAFTLADDKALVLRGEIHGTRVLLLSDLGRLGQRALVERGEDVKADVVVAGFPSNGEPLGEALLERIQPRVVILSDTGHRMNRTARENLQARLRKTGAHIWTTSEQDAVTLGFDPAACRITSMKGQSLLLQPQ